MRISKTIDLKNQVSRRKKAQSEDFDVEYYPFEDEKELVRQVLEKYNLGATANCDTDNFYE